MDEYELELIHVIDEMIDDMNEDREKDFCGYLPEDHIDNDNLDYKGWPKDPSIQEGCNLFFWQYK